MWLDSPEARHSERDLHAQVLRIEKLGEEATEFDLEILEEAETQLRRRGKFLHILSYSGGGLWEYWLTLQGQRDMGYQAGSLRMEAADVMFSWLGMPCSQRMDTWLGLKAMDGIFLEHTHSEKPKEKS